MYQATKEEIIDFYVEEAKREIRARVNEEIEKVENSTTLQNFNFKQAMDQRTWNKSSEDLNDETFNKWLNKQIDLL
ncbi:hypothetical protein [Paenibacillus pini]|uniref:Uncharacterized protein n=1 Tax=Paenibacillus pini JCM 16418 TaxID=1236976 RepID=W7YQN2_9BACL|nr:hypothetical protein [Paenibacillus pini]GAF10872.1 hypothetical protein JCM16418_5101 [Paenibacillus pini JCM 16418]